jgi:hypothetical protein
MPLAGTQDSRSIAVGELLGRPVTLLQCECSATFMRYDTTHTGTEWEPDRIARASEAQDGRDLILLAGEQLTQAQLRVLVDRHLRATLLIALVGSQQNENFVIYRMTPS